MKPGAGTGAATRAFGYLAFGYLAGAGLATVLLAPLGMVAWLSLRDPASDALTGAAWGTILTSGEALFALAYSLLMAAVIAIATILGSLPLAYLIGVRGRRTGRFLFALLWMLWLLDPGIRILGWMQVVKSGVAQGWLTDEIQGSAISEFAAGIHAWLPLAATLMALVFARAVPLQVAMARECGAGPLTIFRHILWPASRPWLLLIGALVFCAAAGGFLEPRLLGSPQFEQATEWLQRAMESEIGWPYASVMLILLLGLAVLPSALILLSRRWR
jgi:spermidine/putrescine transport system permease protein